MLTVLLLFSLPVSAAALLCARTGFRKHGRLAWWSVTLLCSMIMLPNLVLEYATRYELPSTSLDYLGIFISLIGLILMFIGIVAFRSLPMVFCFDPGELTDAGPYRWSRNPQYVGLFLFLLGFALNDWSLWCLAALTVQAINLHLLVLIEEEHLRRTFGRRYEVFRRSTPRYFGIRRPSENDGSMTRRSPSP